MAVRRVNSGPDGVVVAELEGEVDLANVRVATKQLREWAHESRDGLVLDMSNLRYLDSAGVHMLFQLANELGVARKGFALALPEDSPIQRLLAMTNVRDVASVHTSVLSAAEMLRGGRAQY